MIEIWAPEKAQVLSNQILTGWDRFLQLYHTHPFETVFTGLLVAYTLGMMAYVWLTPKAEKAIDDE